MPWSYRVWWLIAFCALGIGLAIEADAPVGCRVRGRCSGSGGGRRRRAARRLGCLTVRRALDALFSFARPRAG
jgi:hypothetical protein